MIKLKNHIKIALGYFVFAAVLGVVLRSFHSVDIPVNYKFFVHTHSHIALLGWVYMALTTLLYKLYLDKLDLDKKYQRIFWFTQLTLAGMLLTFPFLGYAFFSIVFSTLFLFASYWFAWFFLRHAPLLLKKTNAYKCIRVALWYMVVSSLGPWALGAIMNTLGAQSIWYRMAIYFYLHFLYNGWMILVLVGIVLYILEARQISLSNKIFKRFFWSLNLGVVLSFSLSILYINPSILFYILGGVGALLQLFAFRILLKAFAGSRERLDLMLSPFQYGLLKTIVVLLGIKMGLQLLTALPYFANLAATVLDFTIGYLHWTFLGVVSISLFLFFDYFKLMEISKKGYFLYGIGFLVTEALIFYKGIAVWQNFSLFDGYFEVLALASSLIPLSLVIMLIPNRKAR